MVVGLVVILVESFHRADVIALALRFGRDRLSLLYSLPAHLLRGGRGCANERIGTLADGNTPIGHGTIGVGCADCREGFDRLRPEERVQECDRVIELLLRCRGAGNREVDLADFRVGAAVIVYLARRGVCAQQ